MLTAERRVIQTAWTHFKVTITRALAGTHANMSVFEVPCSESGRPKMERLSVEVLNVAELFAVIFGI